MRWFAQAGVGRKIGLGFAVVLSLLVVVGGAGWWSLQGASTGFSEYRALARETNLSGQVEAALLASRMSAKNYMLHGQAEDARQFASRFQEANAFCLEALDMMTDPRRVQHMREIEAWLTEYEAGFEQLRGLQGAFAEQAAAAERSAPALAEQLAALQEQLQADGHGDQARQLAALLRDLNQARLHFADYLRTDQAGLADQARASLDQVLAGLRELHGDSGESGHAARFASALEPADAYATALEQLATITTQRRELVSGTLDRIGPQVAAAVKEIKLGTKAAQDELGPRLERSNRTAVTVILAVGGVALVIGVLLSVLLTRVITRPLNRVIGGLTDAGLQLNEAAGQVATASQGLASAASEQASSLEETSSALEEMAAMTRTSADKSQEADSLSGETLRAADQGGATVKQLNEAVQGISEASAQIGRIMKVIEEIAFQTNLLALNAAVEAARAGEHGKGFAVVADEVRNLAQRSARAAQEITDLITNSTQRSQQGVQVAGEVARAFDSIVGNVRDVTELIGAITQATREQSQGADQVNVAVSQMDRVTQENAANAEESASAAEQLAAQSQAVQGLVEQLQHVVSGAGREDQAPTVARSDRGAFRRSPAVAVPSHQARAPESSDMDFASSFNRTRSDDDGLESF